MVAQYGIPVSHSPNKAELRAAVEEALAEKGVLGEHAGDDVLVGQNFPSISGGRTEAVVQLVVAWLLLVLPAYMC